MDIPFDRNLITKLESMYRNERKYKDWLKEAEASDIDPDDLTVPYPWELSD